MPDLSGSFGTARNENKCFPKSGPWTILWTRFPSIKNYNLKWVQYTYINFKYSKTQGVTLEKIDLFKRLKWFIVKFGQGRIAQYIDTGFLNEF